MRFLALATLLASRTVLAQGFTDVTVESGVEAMRALQPDDWWLSGLTFLDLDNDGDLDLVLSDHSAASNLLGVNDGEGHFTPTAWKASSPSGEVPTTEVHLPYDIDEDGGLDVSFTYDDGGGRWWLNASANDDVILSPSDIIRNASRDQAIADLDGDGNVDWIHSLSNDVVIARGDGKGGFADDQFLVPTPSGSGGIAFPVDLDLDGDLDLVVRAGDYAYSDGLLMLYLNRGGMDFVDSTAELGMASDNLAISGVGDLDQDGDVDLIGLENRALPPSVFLNDGSGHFEKRPGAVSGMSPSSASYGYWGLASVTDVDNDGIADVLIDGRYFFLVLKGDGDGDFTYMNDTWDIPDLAAAAVDSGYAFGDIDGDGDLDLMSYRDIDPLLPVLHRNDLPAQRWIRVRPVGLPGNRGAAAARIIVREAGGGAVIWSEQVLHVCKQAQQGYYAQAETERHYGLGNRSSVDVEVEFHPSGTRVVFQDAPADSIVRVSEDGTNGVILPPDDDDGGPPEGDTDGGGGDPDPGSDDPTPPVREDGGAVRGDWGCQAAAENSVPSLWLWVLVATGWTARRRRSSLRR